jgi:undecaprenyl-diphosphatase
MTIGQAFVLGVVQGVTEFLPVSSSGHLILVPELFGWELQPVSFDAVMHWATLSAVIAALWTDVKATAIGMFRGTQKLGWIILVATIPAVIAGLLFSDQIETTLRNPNIVAFSLAIWGVLLYAADRMMKQNATNDIRGVSWKQGIWIGIAQAIALIPGTSRSGVTITAGLFAGLNRETAARFSFLLGIPAIALAGAAGLRQIAGGQQAVDWLPLIVGFVTAFACGFMAINFLLSLLRSSNFVGFAVYRVLLAALVLTVFF